MNGSSDGNSDLEDSCSEREFWVGKRLSRWRRRRGLDSRCPAVRGRSRGRAGFLPNSQPKQPPCHGAWDGEVQFVFSSGPTASFALPADAPMFSLS